MLTQALLFKEGPGERWGLMDGTMEDSLSSQVQTDRWESGAF